MRKTLIVLMMVLFAAAFLFAGGGNETSKASSSVEKVLKDRLVIVNSLVLQQLDTQNNSTAINSHSYRMTHNTLVDVDPVTGEIIPELATEWSISPDGLVYTFKLRQDVNFQNGEHFTAADVKYTMDRAVTMAAMKAKAGDIGETRVVDDYTVEIVLSKNNVEFLENLTSGNLSIINQKAVESGNGDWGFAVGTGPYVLKEWVPDDYSLYEINENYWGEKPYMKEVKYQKMAEASARVIALQTGEADICFDVPAIEASHVAEGKNTKL